jgi:hypothetical protein
MKKQHTCVTLVACLSGLIGLPATSLATVLPTTPPATESVFEFDVKIDGVDAIFIAGRTDVLPIPTPDGNPNAFILIRHDHKVPEYPLTEKLPPFIPVTEGAVIRPVARAIGGISFYEGFSRLPVPITGPDGNPGTESILSGLGGISGYKGPEGALVGVFLDDKVPSSGPAPVTLDFTPAGLGTHFHSLSPALGQVFFIGDGFIRDKDGKSSSHRYIAPPGATRLVLGIPDGFDFVGVPGAYDDNNGGYRIRLLVDTKGKYKDDDDHDKRSW